MDEQITAVVASGVVQSTMLGELVENARVGVLAIDEGRFVAANTHACQLLGFDREKLIGRRVGELRPDPDVRHQLDEIADGSRSTGNLTVVGKDDRELELSYRVAWTTLAGLETMLAFFWLRHDSG